MNYMRVTKKERHKNAIDTIKHSYMMCALCANKNCNKGCAYFDNKELVVLLLDEYLKLIDNKKISYNDIKLLYKKIELHLKDIDRQRFNEIPHTKLFFKIKRYFNNNGYRYRN